MNKKKGFTLVEVLIAMVIVILIAIVMVGTFVVIKPVEKGRDSQRKKDLNRIQQAFEEYFSDKGNYPLDVNTWNIKSNCHSDKIDFSEYLSPWPCDPNGDPYMIITETNKFRVMANLENKDDDEIPNDWYVRTDILMTGVDKNKVNYGISSPNILWYENYINPNCSVNKCLSSKGGGCGSAGSGCDGDTCFFYDNSNPGSCTDQCKISCCGDKCL